MTFDMRGGAAAALLSALIIYMAVAPASAQGNSDRSASGTSVSGTSVSGTRVLEASDHAELRARISASEVVRIALVGDRIARAVRGEGRFGIEHEPANGDLYLRPPEVAGEGVDRAEEAWTASEAAPAEEPEVLFVGTERGFTYRLILTPVAGGPAQVLIRNPASGSPATREPDTADGRIDALVRLVRAVARGEPLAGYAIHAGSEIPGSAVIETWRGPRFSALLFEAGPSAPQGAEGAADLAGTIGGLRGAGRTGDGARLAALWLAAPGTGPSGGMLAVAVVEDTRAGDAPAADPRRTGDPR